MPFLVTPLFLCPTFSEGIINCPLLMMIQLRLSANALPGNITCSIAAITCSSTIALLCLLSISFIPLCGLIQYNPIKRFYQWYIRDAWAFFRGHIIDWAEGNFPQADHIPILRFCTPGSHYLALPRQFCIALLHREYRCAPLPGSRPVFYTILYL